MTIHSKLTKRNIYIALFVTLYLAVGVVSLFHSFAFFGLANNTIMSVLLGVCFEIGQVAVLMSLLTSKKEQGRIMPWFLMVLLTAVQIIGNIFSSYKYLALHSSEDLRYFKEPIFVWTNLPDNITTVIITYIVGGILPLIALCMTSMVSNYIMDEDNINNDDKERSSLDEARNRHVSSQAKDDNEIQDNIIKEKQSNQTSDVTLEERSRQASQNNQQSIKNEGFVNLM